VADLSAQAHRALHRYASLMKQPLSHVQDFTFYSTHVLRAQESASAYKEALFANHTTTTVLPKIKIRDDLLHNWSTCNAWHHNRTSSHPQLVHPLHDAYYRRIAEDLSTRLGFCFPEALVDAAYTACQFEFGILEIQHQWCSVFSTEELFLLNYLEDISMYYTYGPAKLLNKKLACPLLNRMMAWAGEENVKKKFHLMFAHGETLALLETMLGLFNGEMHAEKDRAMIVSRDLPFAANLHLEVYSCDQNGTHHGLEQRWVRLLMNERMVNVPGCEAWTTSDGLCPLRQFRQLYLEHEVCDVKSMCMLK